MTFWEFVRVVMRRWPVVLMCVLLTVAAGAMVLRDKGVFYTRTEIVFLAPASTDYPNPIRTQSEDIIDTAGAVAKIMSGPAKAAKFASPDVTLVGMGVRDGWTLRLPDTGGQWATNFATQTLVLDIVAPDRGVVERRQAELTERIDDELRALQQAKDVAPVNMITAMVAPQSTIVYHVGGSRARALAMTGALGIGVTIGLVILLEAISRPRRRPVAPRRPALSRVA